MPFVCKLSCFFRRDEIDECEAGIASASMNVLQLQIHKCGHKYSRKSRWLESGECQEYPENRSALVASQVRAAHIFDKQHLFLIQMGKYLAVEVVVSIYQRFVAS